jgi:hypothetical protein
LALIALAAAGLVALIALPVSLSGVVRAAWIVGTIPLPTASLITLAALAWIFGTAGVLGTIPLTAATCLIALIPLSTALPWVLGPTWIVGAIALAAAGLVALARVRRGIGKFGDFDFNLRVQAGPQGLNGLAEAQALADHLGLEVGKRNVEIVGYVDGRDELA